MWITMYPPPPILPACGYVTAIANPVATAASTALPPAFRISTPAWLASALLLATIPCGACVAVWWSPTVQLSGNPAGHVPAGVAGGLLLAQPPMAAAHRTAIYKFRFTYPPRV